MSRRELLLLGLLSAVGGFILLRLHDRHIDTQTSSVTLSPGSIEKIIVNPVTHRLTIVTPGKLQNLFLPDRPSSIEIDKNGKATISSAQFGTEIRPFGGIGGGDKLRLYVGTDLGYYKKWDVGVFVSGSKDVTLRAGINVSYTVYDNFRLSIGMDNAKAVNVFLSVRI